MDNLITLEMLVDKELAKELTEKGLAEIVLRRADAKFRAMVKCQIAGETVSSQTLVHKLDSMAQGLKHFTVEDARSMMHSIDRNTHLLSSTAKQMVCQVDSIYQLTSSVMNLSYLNVGLSLANIAVDAVGFVVVTQKLNTLNAELQGVAGGVGRIEVRQKNSTIRECEELIMRCNSMGGKLTHGDEVNLDTFEELLWNLKGFLSNIRHDSLEDALNKELTLQMIYTLLPAYTVLLNEFIRRYFFSKQRLHNNYPIFLGLYDELNSRDFIEQVEDYFFLEQGKHSSEVIDIINAQKILNLNGQLQLEEQALLLTTLETKEKVLLVEQGLKNYTEAQLLP